jgi:hypothetical protein
MDLALSVQAAVQNSQTDAASEYARRAAQTAAALERVPLVVGFSDRRSDAASYPEVVPQFGWVFGPRFRYDAIGGKFVFEQGVASYDVSADVSVPSWWPRIELDLETAWIKNWHSTAEVLPAIPSPAGAAKSAEGHKHKGHLTIPLPLTRADLDGLTKFLTQRSLGGSQEFTSIRFVEPTVVSACASEVTFLIYGANIWRSAEVFFGGLSSKEVKVLPDMEGISARFPLSTLLQQRNNSRSPFGYSEVALRVNTRNGNDWRPIRLVGERHTPSELDQKNDTTNCEAPYNVTTPIIRQQSKEAPIIYDVAPTKLSSCQTSPVFIITGRYLLSLDNKEPPKFYLGGEQGASQVVGAGQNVGSVQVVSVTFDHVLGERMQTQFVPLIAVNEAGFVSMSIDISPCIPKETARAEPEQQKKRARP